jgi:hypothetical protein
MDPPEPGRDDGSIGEPGLPADAPRDGAHVPRAQRQIQARLRQSPETWSLLIPDRAISCAPAR